MLIINNVVYYKDEHGNLCNPVELDVVYRTSKIVSEYYISNITSAWDKAKIHVSDEVFSKLNQEVEDYKQWIETTFKPWFENLHIHCENPDPPEGFDCYDGSLSIKVCTRGYDWYSTYFEG
jgi:hypothetical protein